MAKKAKPASPQVDLFYVPPKAPEAIVEAPLPKIIGKGLFGMPIYEKPAPSPESAPVAVEVPSEAPVPARGDYRPSTEARDAAWWAFMHHLNGCMRCPLIPMIRRRPEGEALTVGCPTGRDLYTKYEAEGRRPLEE